MFLSEKKLMKMLFDIDAFMSAAIYLQVVLEREYYPRISTYTADRGEFGRTLALSTAMQTNLGILFACGKIAVEPKITEAIEKYADVVPASEAGLDGFRIPVYRIKPEIEKCFPSDEFDQFDE